MKKKFKLIIDISMTILFILMMGYHLFGEENHEWMGIVLFSLFCVHQLLNIRWYKRIRKGSYSYQRRLFIIINFLLLTMTMITMVSGILISKNLFSFIDIGSTSLMRQLHMLGSSWTYVLISIHLGLHLMMMKRLFNDKILIKRIIMILFSLLCLYGCYAFIKREIYLDLFLLVEFKFLPYGENVLLFFVDFISIMLVGTAIGHNLLYLKKVK